MAVEYSGMAIQKIQQEHVLLCQELLLKVESAVPLVGRWQILSCREKMAKSETDISSDCVVMFNVSDKRLNMTNPLSWCRGSDLLRYGKPPNRKSYQIRRLTSGFLKWEGPHSRGSACNCST